ncbi:MAG: type II and III secretion system protein [Candidatus Margulisbacteria bacterium]|nr:type II and III secretion system protein [Candidatus Margulisiibacteriota bacterium]
MFWKKLSLVVLIIGSGFCFSAQAVFNYSNNAPQTETIKEQSICFDYQYLSEEEILSVSQKLFPSLKVSVNKLKKKIFVAGAQLDIRKFRTFVGLVDTNKKSVYFKTWLIEVNQNKLEGLGINWQNYKSGLNVGDMTDKQKLFDNLNILVSKGDAKILANPTLICLEDEIAFIKVGDRIPYTVPVESASDRVGWELQYIDSGINLSIRPNILSDGLVSAVIKLKVDNVKQWKSTMAGEYPVLSSREINLQCQIKNGEELVLGGLINSSERRNVSSLPILGDIPFIGSFFSQTTIEQEDTEIVFILSPEIVKM